MDKPINNKPDEKSEFLRVVPFYNWLLLSGISIVVTLLVIWSIFGRLNNYIETIGILLPGSLSQIIPIESSTDGTIDSILVKQNQKIKSQQQLFTFAQDNSQKNSSISSITSGNIFKVNAYVGQQIKKGDNLGFILRGQTKPQLLVFLNNKASQKVTTGLRSYSTPLGDSAYQYGTIKGYINTISEYPFSISTLEKRIPGLILEKQVINHSTSLKVANIRLTTAQNASGYQWTSGEGPPMPIQPGTIFQVRILVSSQAPITKAIPALQEWFDNNA